MLSKPRSQGPARTVEVNQPFQSLASSDFYHSDELGQCSTYMFKKEFISLALFMPPTRTGAGGIISSVFHLFLFIIIFSFFFFFFFFWGGGGMEVEGGRVFKRDMEMDWGGVVREGYGNGWAGLGCRGAWKFRGRGCREGYGHMAMDILSIFAN